MPSIPRVRMVPETFVLLLFEFLAAQGLDAESVVGEPWPQVSSGWESRCTVERWATLLARAVDRLNDRNLGLHLARTLEPRHLGVLGYILAASNDLEGVLQRFLRYHRLGDGVAVRCRSGPNWIEILWDFIGPSAGALVGETGMAFVTQFCRNIVAGALSPELVTFVTSAPAKLSPYEEFFGCPVLFDQARTSVRFPSSVLSLRLKSPDPALIGSIERRANELLQCVPRPDPLLERVRELTTRMLKNGQPDVRGAAKLLECTPRTLQRRLKDLGTDFRSEVATARRELADAYLKDSALQIVDIALLLGYSEHSAFSRSYKQWTGSTPAEWRARNSGKS